MSDDEKIEKAEESSQLTEYWNDRLPPLELPRMTDDELRKFVNDFLEQRIFTSAHIPSNQLQNMLGMIFMPLGFGALKHNHPDSFTQVGLIYEYMDQALPRSINGMPMFFSCRMVHKEDWHRAIPVIQAEEERRKNLNLLPIP